MGKLLYKLIQIAELIGNGLVGKIAAAKIYLT